jgi:hypothetical protein
MRQTSVIEDLEAVLSFILSNPLKAYEILSRIIQELKKEKVTQ